MLGHVGVPVSSGTAATARADATAPRGGRSAAAGHREGGRKPGEVEGGRGESGKVPPRRKKAYAVRPRVDHGGHVIRGALEGSSGWGRAVRRPGRPGYGGGAPYADGRRFRGSTLRRAALPRPSDQRMSAGSVQPAFGQRFSECRQRSADRGRSRTQRAADPEQIDVPPDHPGLGEATGAECEVASMCVHARPLALAVRPASGVPAGRVGRIGPVDSTRVHSTLTAGRRSDNPPRCRTPSGATDVTPAGRGLCSTARRSYRACRS